MKIKKGLKQKFLEILNSKPFIGLFIFIILGLAMVIASDVIVKQGAIEVGDDLNVSGFVYANSTSVGIGNNSPTAPLYVYGNRAGTGYVTTIEAHANQPALSIKSTDGGASTYVLMTVTADNSADKLFGAAVSGDTFSRFQMNLNGFEMGTGSATRDTNLYRSATNKLKTDDTFLANIIGINVTSPAYTLEINNLTKAMNVSGLLYVNSTNIGIGTNNPINSLTVVGEVNITGISNDGNGKVVCIKSNGDLGTCSSAVGVDGTCTCG